MSQAAPGWDSHRPDQQAKPTTPTQVLQTGVCKATFSDKYVWFRSQSVGLLLSSQLSNPRPNLFASKLSIWLWVKIQIVPPVNIPIPTKIGSKMGGEFTKMGSHLTVLTTMAIYRPPPPHRQRAPILAGAWRYWVSPTPSWPRSLAPRLVGSALRWARWYPFSWWFSRETKRNTCDQKGTSPLLGLPYKWTHPCIQNGGCPILALN